jgi:hypothetical protein
MPTFTPRLAVVLVALSAIGGAVPLAAQGTPAMATVYLKEGGVIQGQILNENDPNGVRIKSAKSGTTFVLKTVWIDSIVKAPAPPAPAAAPAPAAPAPKPVAPMAVAVAAPSVAAPVVSAPAAPAPALTAVAAPVPSAVPVKSEPLPPKPSVPAPVVDGLGPPPAAAAAPAKASKSSAEKKPAKFSHWYVGGGGSAPTGAMGTSTDIGYSGMLAYAAGIGKMTQMRIGGAGNYWAESSSDANFYDVTGTLDLLIGKRIPGFIAPYGLIGGVGGVRNTSPPPGFIGYARNPLYGGRVGAGLNSRRIFVEVSYQKVWVDGATQGYVPFVFGFRF